MVDKRSSVKLLRFLNVGALIFGLLLLAACNGRPPAHSHDHHPTGFAGYTGPQDGLWPPQPKNITNVQAIESEALDGALTVELESQLVSRLTQSSDVQSALGQDYAYLQSERMTQKGEAPHTVSVFYSYSNNQTVEVSEFSGNQINVRTFSPNAYQPPEGEKEVGQAVKLARAKLIAKGHRDVGRLDGGALLAFAGGAAGESGFFRSRVLYVTFATGPDSLPEYFAYVDLTNKSVLEHGPIN